MASLSKDSSGRYVIQVLGTDGRRRSIRTGLTSKKLANEVKLRVEHLHALNVAKLPMDADTAAWVAGIGDELADKLAAVGLIEDRAKAVVVTLGDFLRKFMENRPEARPNTANNWQQAAKKMYAHFGEATDISTINPGHVDEWVAELKRNLAPAYVARLIKFGRQFFHHAIRMKLVKDNPFAGIKAGAMTNPARIRFVTAEETERILDACPSAEWRVIVALCRYGGLRCPSELLALTWADVDWDRNRFLVRSSKTAHHEAGGRRWVPIFPELKPHLEASFELAEPGTLYVVSRKHSHETNIRTAFTRIIYKAGLLPWERLFQNLRASRETELAQTYPLHVAVAWIGNSALVAAKHYLSVTESDFAKAAGAVPEALRKSGAVGGANSGAVVVQNAVQSEADGKRPEYTVVPEAMKNGLKASLCPAKSIADTEHEYTRQESNNRPFPSAKPQNEDTSGANSGAVSDTSAAMAAFVNTLTAEQRAALTALLGNASEANYANNAPRLTEDDRL